MIRSFFLGPIAGRVFLAHVLLALSCSIAIAAPPPGAKQPIIVSKLQYNRDIRPILAENCFACHGPDSASRKADLRLDRRESAIEMGAINPGQASESELVKRITSADEDTMMPPAASHKKLSAEQKKLLTDWIASGAEYQPHWSFIAPVRPPLPEVQDKAWPRNGIDNFILARLESVGLRPAPEA